MYRNGGTALVLVGLLIVLIAGLSLLAVPSDVAASHSGTLEERRAIREAERAAKVAAKEAEEAAEAAQCGCKARLKFSRPDIRFNGAGQLVFIPRVDVRIRTRGEAGGPDWAARVVYEGSTSYQSEDVSVPDGVTFSGEKDIVSGQCGRNKYRIRGLKLTPVPLSDIIRSLVGIDQELEGSVRLQAHIEGCGFEEEEKSSRFILKEFGNLKVKNWRSVR